MTADEVAEAIQEFVEGRCDPLITKSVDNKLHARGNHVDDVREACRTGGIPIQQGNREWKVEGQDLDGGRLVVIFTTSNGRLFIVDVR